MNRSAYFRETAKSNPWTDEHDHWVMELRAHGVRFEDIAKQLKRCEGDVRDRYDELTGRNDYRVTLFKDPWNVPVDYSAHDVKVKPSRTVIWGDQMRSRVMSECGNAAAMCAGYAR